MSANAIEYFLFLKQSIESDVVDNTVIAAFVLHSVEVIVDGFYRT